MLCRESSKEYTRTAEIPVYAELGINRYLGCTCIFLARLSAQHLEREKAKSRNSLAEEVGKSLPTERRKEPKGRTYLRFDEMGNQSGRLQDPLSSATGIS